MKFFAGHRLRNLPFSFVLSCLVRPSQSQPCRSSQGYWSSQNSGLHLHRSRCQVYLQTFQVLIGLRKLFSGGLNTKHWNTKQLKFGFPMVQFWNSHSKLKQKLWFGTFQNRTIGHTNKMATILFRFPINWK